MGSTWFYLSYLLIALSWGVPASCLLHESPSDRQVAQSRRHVPRESFEYLCRDTVNSLVTTKSGSRNHWDTSGTGQLCFGHFRLLHLSICRHFFGFWLVIFSQAEAVEFHDASGDLISFKLNGQCLRFFATWKVVNSVNSLICPDIPCPPGNGGVDFYINGQKEVSDVDCPWLRDMSVIFKSLCPRCGGQIVVCRM